MRLPIVQDLIECPSQFHAVTLKEIGITFIFSFMLLWLSASLMLLFTDVVGFYGSVLPNIKNGELLIYCNSIVAPIFYIALEESEHYKTFPSKIAHLLIFFLVMVFAAVCFSLQKLGVKVNSNNIVPFSIIALGVSLFIRYSSGTINRRRKNPASEMSRQQTSYVNGYEAHRSGK